MATRTTLILRSKGGLRLLFGAAALAVVLFASGAVALARSHDPGAPLSVSASTTADFNAGGTPKGGMAELYDQQRQATASATDGVLPIGGMAELYRDQARRPAAQQAVTDNPIVGAWATNASSTTAGITANLLAFTSSGQVFWSSSNFPMYSAGLGAWADAGDGTVIVTVVYRRADPSGAYVGSTRFSQQLTVADDGMSYSGPFSTELTDPLGTVTATGQGQTRATRIVPTAPTN